MFNADSLRFAGFFTLSDLLGQLPGVYVARGGFFGQAESVFYGGRGAGALEVFWDGLPYLPLGRDSVYLDPARIPLAPLERVEVSPLPGTLRVYLVSSRQRSTTAASSVGIVTGDRDIARYLARFAKRSHAGAGISLVADWADLNGSGGTSSSAFNSFDFWGAVELTRGERFGASAQLLTSSWERAAAPALVDHWKSTRSDLALRMFVAPLGGPLGPRFELTVGGTAADGDSAVARRTAGQVTFTATQQWRRASLWGAARLGDGRRPLEIEARGSWTGGPGVTLAAELRRAEYRGGRVGTRALTSVGLTLPGGFALRGAAVRAKDVQAPTLPGDTAQTTTDLLAALRWDGRWATLELQLGRRDSFAPSQVPAGLLPLTDLRASPDTRYRTVFGSVRPASWLTVSGWYFDPLDGGGDFEPPHHARVDVTFFSRFLRTFPSGIFALRGDVRLESWTGWTAGVGAGGAALQLRGAALMDLHIAMQIGDVTAFWTMRNANGLRKTYVPGLGYPTGLQAFGVRWDFRN